MTELSRYPKPIVGMLAQKITAAVQRLAERINNLCVNECAKL